MNNNVKLSEENQIIIDYINKDHYLDGLYNSNYPSAFDDLILFMRAQNFTLDVKYFFYYAGKLGLKYFHLPNSVLYWNNIVLEDMKNAELLCEQESGRFNKIKEPTQDEVKNHKTILNNLFDFSSEEYKTKVWEKVSHQNWLDYEEQKTHTRKSVEDYYDDEDEDFCNACQNSPCICSDPERTSTTYDR
jgi:hypothetical protein